MKTYKRFVKIMALTLIFVACDATQKRGVDYEIASPVYVALAEKSLDYLVSFDWDSFAEMLTDSIEYELPDGTKMIGKTALINYWKNCKTNVGIKSMKITNANYLPLDAHSKLKNSDSLGIKVVVDFTNNMMVKNKDVSVKMNFSFHFNQQKLIDRINSNYDQTLFQELNFGTIN